MCVCVCKMEREREREKDGKKDKDGKRKKQREKKREVFCRQMRRKEFKRISEKNRTHVGFHGSPSVCVCV